MTLVIVRVSPDTIGPNAIGLTDADSAAGSTPLPRMTWVTEPPGVARTTSEPPAIAPFTVGANTTVMSHVAPAARVWPAHALFVICRPAPERVAPIAPVVGEFAGF